MSPIVMEVAGPAAAGKTTLINAVKNQQMSVETVTHYRSVSYAPSFFFSALRLMPMLLRHCTGPRRLNWSRLRMMIHLKALGHTLARAKSKSRVAMIMDQGPVFMMSRLHESGLERAEGGRIAAWWDRVLVDWAARLDLVVWLDAPDEVLLERIRSREKPHLVKSATAEETYKFLRSARDAHQYILSELTRNGGPAVLRFDTDRSLSGEVAQQLLSILAKDRGVRNSCFRPA